MTGYMTGLSLSINEELLFWVWLEDLNPGLDIKLGFE
jgi:hypothetical protein